jgi:hypothetical protein
LVKEGGEERGIGEDSNPIGTSPNQIDRKALEDARDRFSSLLTASQRKRKISFTLYQDEYDFVQEHFKTQGYKRTEYFLACISSAKKTSMNASYRNFINIRAERKRQERTQVQNVDGKVEGEVAS